MHHISETIRGFFPDKDKLGLPNTVRCTRHDVAGKTYTWSQKHGLYVAEGRDEGFMPWYVARGLGVIFF
jgi:hypothetical protein